MKQWIIMSRTYKIQRNNYLPPAAKRPPYVCASVRLSVRQVFTETLISHSFIKISSPNSQGMFMAIKTCLCKILASF